MNELFFRKKLNYRNQIFDFNNAVFYEIYKDEELVSTLNIESTLTGEFVVDGKIYRIKPLVKFWSMTKLEILCDTNKIGEINFWGWTFKNPNLIIYKDKNISKWIFNRNNPGLFRNRKDNYTTELTSENDLIKYEISIKKFLINNTQNNCLREVEGRIAFLNISMDILILGIFLNELLIFDETEK